MSKKKAGGSSKNLRDSNPQYLGVKRADGTTVKAGEILVRQRGTKIEAGNNVRVGKDHTLFADTPGRVSFSTKRKMRYNGATVRKTVASITPLENATT